MIFWWRRWIEQSRSCRWDDGAVGVPEHLDLHVARSLDVALDQQRAVRKGVLGLAARALDRRLQLVGSAHHAHALATATGAGLDESGKAHLAGPSRQRGGVLLLARVAFDDGHAGRLRDRLRLPLGAHPADHVRLRTYEPQPGVAAGLGEVGILGQETKARVHGVGASQRGRGQDAVGGEVGLGCRGRPQPHGLVGPRHERRVGVRVGEDGHRIDGPSSRRCA